MVLSLDWLLASLDALRVLGTSFSHDSVRKLKHQFKKYVTDLNARRYIRNESIAHDYHFS